MSPITSWAELMTLPERSFLDSFIRTGPRSWSTAAAAHLMDEGDVIRLQHSLLAEPGNRPTSRELGFLADLIGGTGRDWWGDLADRYGFTPSHMHDLYLRLTETQRGGWWRALVGLCRGRRSDRRPVRRGVPRPGRARTRR